MNQNSNYIHSEMNKLLYSLLPSIILVFCSCDKSDNATPLCDQYVVIDNDEYNNAPSDPLIIHKATIDGDCLEISFGASCCDGETWVYKLVASEIFLYSNPPLGSIRLSLKNDELCEAVCGKTVFFDITLLRVSGNKVILHLSGWEDSILYEY